ncbi:MAG: hypothetical protein JW741_24285 [Sedimentisphaerales bacterium]|nr:hypothetical protein [Sedimentisphaerales bacterium]
MPSLMAIKDMPQRNYVFATPSMAMLATAEKEQLYQCPFRLSTPYPKKGVKKQNFL